MTPNGCGSCWHSSAGAPVHTLSAQPARSAEDRCPSWSRPRSWAAIYFETLTRIETATATMSSRSACGCPAPSGGPGVADMAAARRSSLDRLEWLRRQHRTTRVIVIGARLRRSERRRARWRSGALECWCSRRARDWADGRRRSPTATQANGSTTASTCCSAATADVRVSPGWRTSSIESALQPQLAVDDVDRAGRRSRLSCPSLPPPFHLLGRRARMGRPRLAG